MAAESDPFQNALSAAYRYLNRRERTVAEMRRQLEGAGSDPGIAEMVVQTLRIEGYLDDRRYARLFVEDKRTLEQWGSERIRRALIDRGIDREVVDDALRSPEGRGETDRAVALLRQRFPQPIGDRRDRERALGMLIRKGYDSELAVEAVNAHLRAGAVPDWLD